MPYNPRLYTARGVPYDVAHKAIPDDYLDFLVNAVKITENTTRTMRPSEQRRVFEQTLKHPLKFNTYIIAGATDDRMAKIAAFELFLSAYGKTPNQPYWHTVYGNYKDPIRDDSEFRDYQLGSPALLVIANIPANATNVKLEKVRDLCEMYNQIPKILVVAGDDPYSFCAKYLFINAHKHVLAFD